MEKKYDAVVIGCGLSGSVVARHLAENRGKCVLILERREHIGGNMYDYMDESGIWVHKYGPHTFHTKKEELYSYMCRFAKWKEYHLKCGAVFLGKYTPTPFNFRTIDIFYTKEKADLIKNAVKEEFPEKDYAPILELLDHSNKYIKEYARFLFANDYAPYTAKQWGISHKKIDPSVLKRVPVRFDYVDDYFDDAFQVMPEISYTDFFNHLLDHKKIDIRLNCEAKERLRIRPEDDSILFDGEKFEGEVIYTGPIDELFDFKFGRLPYRSLRFEWKTEQKESFQEAPVVAYPEVEDYTRITEYKKLPHQNILGITTYAVEYPLPYQPGEFQEPYYPVLTKDSQQNYLKYEIEARKYTNLYLCGRLADFKYYNMDQALERALEVCKILL